jgi:FRG domain
MHNTVKFDSWSNLVSYFRQELKSNKWIFRGQRLSEWTIESSLERTFLRRFGVARNEIPKIESGLLRAFKRRAHHYVKDLPVEKALIEWLALMQHYGAPTRLVDWTYSFYIAAYFAIEKAFVDETCSIWCFDYEFWGKRAKSLMSDDTQDLMKKDPNNKNSETVEAILKSVPLVFPLNPFRMNERLGIQQGIFLVPTDIKLNFMENLRLMSQADSDRDFIRKVDVLCTKELIFNAFQDLKRMNINTASLFPGLDGFSRNLHSTGVDHGFYLPVDA